MTLAEPMPGFENEDVEEWLLAVSARSIPITRSGMAVALTWCETYLPTLTREEAVALLRQVELELPVLRDPLPAGTAVVPAGDGHPVRIFYTHAPRGGRPSPQTLVLPQPALALACRAAGRDDTSLGLPSEASIRSGAGARLLLLPELQVKLARAKGMRGSSWPGTAPKGTGSV